MRLFTRARLTSYVICVATCWAGVLQCIFGRDLLPLQISASINGAPTSGAQVATDGGSTVIAVWQQQNAIFGASFDVSTKTWSTPCQLSSSQGKKFDPRATIVANNKAIVTWASGDSSPYDLYAITFIPPCNRGTELKLNPNDVMFDGDAYCTVTYTTNQALVAWANTEHDKIRATLTDGSTVVQEAIVSSDDMGDAKMHPCVAVHPITNVPYVVYAEQDHTGGHYHVTGIPVPAIANPCKDSNYTIFSVGNCVESVYNFPQILLNFADNEYTPVVFYARNAGGTAAQIVASVWSPIYSSSGSDSDPQYINNFDSISTALLVNNQNIQFSVINSASNIFDLIYTQNNYPFLTYATRYTLGSAAAPNDLISSAGAANFHNVPQIANITLLRAGKSGPLILWEQNNKLYAGFYNPDTHMVDAQQLSSDSDGAIILGPVLAGAQHDTLPIIVWNQGSSANKTQLFGLDLNQLYQTQVKNVCTRQELHRFVTCSTLANVISWQPTFDYVAYRVYLRPQLDIPVATIARNCQLIFTDYCINPCTTYTYYLVGIDSAGFIDNPLVITISPSST